MEFSILILWSRKSISVYFLYIPTLSLETRQHTRPISAKAKRELNAVQDRMLLKTLCPSGPPIALLAFASASMSIWVLPGTRTRS